MDKCTAVMVTSTPAPVLALLCHIRELQDGHVLCELGENHEDDHAVMLDDTDGTFGGALWARWNETSGRITLLPWCPAGLPEDRACGLFVDHGSGHGWEVIDPTTEAIRRELAKRYPAHFPEYGDDDRD
ncbi:hypothetical protein ACFU67_21510 [Streptomyces rhizosphaericola]|uniref:hypothetical protein n=1 Tax=Streptomyces rhizosphaericola TaxID=2564098 RepID=UPI0036D1F24B